MSDEMMDQLMPDPSQGEIAKKAKLLALAKEHGIMRIAAEKGLSVDDAINFIEAHHERLAQAALPKEYYSLLKGVGKNE